MTEKQDKRMARILWFVLLASIISCLVLFQELREQNIEESRIVNTINK